MSLQEPHNNFKWPVSIEREIAVPALDVWTAISRPGNLELCHPFCVSNPVRVWAGPSSQDEVHYLSGWVYERLFRRWIEGVGYDLEIGRSDGSKSFTANQYLKMHSAHTLGFHPENLHQNNYFVQTAPGREQKSMNTK
jgi:hypothetical protein